jgi:hypothetical protein
MSEARTFRSPKQLLHKEPHPVEPEDKPHEVRSHHHEDVEHRAERAGVPVPGLVAVLRNISNTSH